MPRITKAMLEEDYTFLVKEITNLHHTIELQAREIVVLKDLVKLSPTGGLFMAMMSTNKLARKMVEGRIK